MKIILHGERPLSWNKYYAGQHWSKRKREADRVHWLVRSFISDPIMFTVPVDIVITAYFDHHPLDPDNILSKVYIDGLVGVVLKDDTYKYVSSVTTRSQVSSKNPRVEIELKPHVGHSCPVE